jgi:pimeloyl-ACP methyl ester carboxylesterase
MVGRIVATNHPELVRAVVLAAASAKRVEPDVNQTPFIAGDLDAPEAERLAALREAFFAPGHDPHIWLEGWYLETLKTQKAAVERTTSLATYWACGEAPILEIIAEFDPFKPRPFWGELKEKAGNRVTSTVIADAAHALFPEQPDAVRAALPRWAERHRP